MKNVRNSIKITIALCFVTILAAITCLLVWQKPASVNAETATDENEVQLVINEYGDGQADLTESGGISVTSGVLGETVDISGGNWYTDGSSEVYYCDALSEDGGSISLDARTMTLSASYETDEAAVYNNIEARASDDLAEHAVGSAVVDAAEFCALPSNSANSKAAFANTQRNTYDNDGIMTTSIEDASESWYTLSPSAVKKLQETTCSKEIKRQIISEIGDSKYYHDIEKFFPLEMFENVGKSCFIGSEIGLICNVTNMIPCYPESNALTHEYVVESLVIFSFDRVLDGRQYCVNTSIVFNGAGLFNYRPESKLHYNNIYPIKQKDFKVTVSDPIVSLSINNLYKKNDFNSDYDIDKDREIAISQLRMNYSGFAGKKEKRKYDDSKSVSSFVAGLALDLSSIWKNINNLIYSIPLNIPKAIATKALSTVYGAYKFIKSYATDFVSVNANNEKNIKTFPAPSQQPIKDALSAFGIDKGKENESPLTELENTLNYIDGANAGILLAKKEHYTQSIFVMSEVDRPIAATTFVDLAVGVDLSGWNNSKIQKFHIPAKYNYSGMTERLFDAKNVNTVKYEEGAADVKAAEIAEFDINKIDLDLVVEESGIYELFLRDLKRVRADDTDMDVIESGVNNSYAIEPINAENYRDAISYRNINNAKFDKGANAVVIKVKLEKGHNDFKMRLKDAYGAKCIGYELKALLEKHMDELKENKTESFMLTSEQNRDFVFRPERTGIYRINTASQMAVLDILNSREQVIVANRQICETLMVAGQAYHIVVKSDSNIPALVRLKAVRSAEKIQRNFKGSFWYDSVGKWYPLVIQDSGSYTFTVDGGVCLWLKDALQREMLYGADKTYLNTGVYYLYVESMSQMPVSYNVSVEFTPDEIKTDSSRVVFNDTSYKYVPVVSGKYEISVGDGYAVTVDGGAYERAEYGGGEIALERGVPYIITAKATGEKVVGAQLKINFVPQGGIYGFNSPIDAVTTSATFVTRISGEYLLDGEGVAAYTEGMTAVQAVNGRYWFDAGETYYIVKGEGVRCEVALYAKQVPVNSKFNVQPNGVYYYLLCPVKDGEHTVSVRGGSAFSLYTHDGLAADVALASTGGAYTLVAGEEYYLRVETAGSPELVTVSSGGGDALPSMVEDMTVEEAYSAGNDRTVYTFTPDASGKYKFVFFRERGAAYTVSVAEGGRAMATESFGSMNYVLSFVLELSGGVTYEIENRLETAIADETALAFGVSKTTTGSLNVVVDGALQTDGTVNKIALGDDRNGLTYMQIAVQNLFGNATYRALNAPIINGSAAVRVNANGLLEVSNRLAQWTAFAVEVNVGRCEYGDVVIDEGITRVVNFVVYNKVENIQIVDGNDAAITVIDIAPKASVDLRARIYPMFAAQAETVTFAVSEADRQFVDVSGSGEYVTVTGRAVTDNNKYAKVYVSCADEFTVVVMIRVHAEEIYARKQSDLDALSEAHSAYEVIVETSVIKSIDLSGLRNVNYLKIRGSSVTKLTSFMIMIGADDFDLVLENIEIYGSGSGTVQSLGKKLTVHFKGDVELYGADSLNDSLPTGRSAIVADALYLRQYEKSTVGIYGGAGYSYQYSIGTGRGGTGGAAITAKSVDITTISDFIIRGGTGGRGMIGKDGKDAGETDGRGSTGEKGATGGDGGYGIDSSRLTISGASIKIFGGEGGRGGTGGVGGRGKYGVNETGENGCDGGTGGDGGDGGNGGRATSASVDWQSGWVNVSGDDGKQGDGGRGGRGGDGGSGKNDTSVGAKSSPGGNGGNGGLGGSGYVNGLRGDGGNGGDGGDPGGNGPGERGGNGGSGYNGGHGGVGASTGHTWQAGGRGGNGGDAYGGSVGVGGKGGTGGPLADDGKDGANGVQYGVDPAV